jgi:hypothetical protein
MASRAMIPFLIAMMLLTGVCNTLFTKYQVGSFAMIPLAEALNADSGILGYAMRPRLRHR